MTQITKYTLFFFLHLVIYYIERWYRACARKIIYYHLDTANQKTNMVMEKWQKSKKVYAK